MHEQRTQALLHGPLGCALLLDMATNPSIPIETFASPGVSFWLAGQAVDWWDPHRDGFRVEWALTDGGQQRDIAQAIARHPAFAWWWEPMDTEAQVWLSPRVLRGNANADHNPTYEPLDPFRPEHWIDEEYQPGTGTLRGGTTAEATAYALTAADFISAFPLAGWRVRPMREAQVWEVHHPRDWHALCTAYPKIAQDGRLTPEWSAVAREWDGVHLSLGGVLSCERARYEDAHGWSMMEGWHVEGTKWVGNIPMEGHRLPDFQRSAHRQNLQRYPYRAPGSGTRGTGVHTPP